MLYLKRIFNKLAIFHIALYIKDKMRGNREIMSRYAVNKQMQQRQRGKAGFILWIPIMFLLGIVPLITRLKISEPTLDAARTYKLQMAVDFFSYYKALFIIIVTVVMLIAIFYTITKEDMRRYKKSGLYIGAAGVFLLFTMMSTLFSSYKQDALWGVPGRREGMLIIICYVIMMLYALNVFKEAGHYKYMVISLAVLIAVMTFLGVFEYMGKNILVNTEWGKDLLIPKEYEKYRNSIGVSYDKGKVYGTMFHYNYMGSFAALMVPLFGTFTLWIKEKKEKICYGLLTVASLFLLFGSTSRGGLIGVGLAILIGAILFSKTIIKAWKSIAIISAVLIGIIITFNVLTGGSIFERIPSLIKDTIIGFTPSAKEFDYLDYLPIRDIKAQDGKMIITTQTDTLILVKEEGVRFYDQNGKSISYQQEEVQTGSTPIITLQDPRFEGIGFKRIVDANNQLSGMILNINGLDTLVLKIDEVDGIYLIDSFTQERIQLDYPETFGFRGKERLGSARGYIWSRSIPMLKETWLIGHGPDTYAFEFPQQDYLGKYYAYGTPHMIVDKPHNLYLQIGINQGIIVLIAFLVLVSAYIIESLKLYGLKSNYQNEQIIGIAVMLSVIGYLGAGLFNDSVVAVAPIFWILLGAGIAINYLNKQQLSFQSIQIHTKK